MRLHIRVPTAETAIKIREFLKTLNDDGFQDVYDVGTREVFGIAPVAGDEPRFLEDYIMRYRVVYISQVGGEEEGVDYYKRGPTWEESERARQERMATDVDSESPSEPNPKSRKSKSRKPDRK